MWPVLVALLLAAPQDLLELHRPAGAHGLPPGWRLRAVKGQGPPMFIVRGDGEGRTLRISGMSAAAWAQRALETPIEEGGLLRWSWRVLELPAGADLRARETDDSALRIYVVFGRPRGLFGRPEGAIFYTWGNAEPMGLTLKSRVSDRIEIVRVAGAMEADGRWREHAVDPFADFRRSWGRSPPPITAVGLMQDTDMTHGHAVSELRDLRWDPR